MSVFLVQTYIHKTFKYVQILGKPFISLPLIHSWKSHCLFTLVVSQVGKVLTSVKGRHYGLSWITLNYLLLQLKQEILVEINSSFLPVSYVFIYIPWCKRSWSNVLAGSQNDCLIIWHQSVPAKFTITHALFSIQMLTRAFKTLGLKHINPPCSFLFILVSLV